MMKRLIFVLPLLLTMSCQTRLVSVNFRDLEQRAIASICHYYPEYEGRDLVMESVSYSSHVSPFLPRGKAIRVGTPPGFDGAFEDVSVSFLIRDTIQYSPIQTHDVMIAKLVSVAMNPDGTLVAGRQSISFHDTQRKLKK